MLQRIRPFFWLDIFLELSSFMDHRFVKWSIQNGEPLQWTEIQWRDQLKSHYDDKRISAPSCIQMSKKGQPRVTVVPFPCFTLFLTWGKSPPDEDKRGCAIFARSKKSKHPAEQVTGEHAKERACIQYTRSKKTFVVKTEKISYWKKAEASWLLLLTWRPLQKHDDRCIRGRDDRLRHWCTLAWTILALFIYAQVIKSDVIVTRYRTKETQVIMTLVYCRMCGRAKTYWGLPGVWQ